MGEVSIKIALDKIRSEKVKDRSDGLADLRHILLQNRQTPKLEALSDKAYHKIFETLFRISKAESSNFARSSRAPARTQAASRLSACAGVLRVAVEVGVRKLRYKTVRALVDHVIQTLPTADDGYCAPLVPDYFKILRTILQYQPHPEHFPSEVWNELTDFCVAVVNDLNRLLEDGDSSLSHRLRASDSFQDDRSRSVTPSLRVSSSRKSTQTASQHSEGTTLKNSSENIVLCLKHLHSVPSAPVSEKAAGTLEVMLDLLRKSPNVSHTQQAAFDCINSILARIVTDDTILALETIRSLIPLICRFWQAKSHALKDSMIISLLYGENFFRRLVVLDVSGEHTTDLESLLEIFKEDYCKRIERDTLQMEDLDLSQESVYSECQAPLSLSNFRPRFGLVKAEQPWALLQISSSVVTALDINVNVLENQDIHDDATHASKRRKFNSARGDIVQQIKVSAPSEKLYSLQVLGFLLNAIDLDTSSIQEILDILLSCISDSNESSTSWAMLALSCAANQNAAMSVQLGPSWLAAWRISARHVTLSATCRAACHLMGRLLNVGLVPYSQVKDITEGVLSSIDVNGPAVAVDATIHYWATVAILRATDNLGSAYDTIERVLRWLFKRWSPRTLFDRQHTAQNAQSCSTNCILHLFSVCLGLPVHPTNSCRAPNLGRVAQARLVSLSDQRLVQYLLLEEGFTLNVRAERGTNMPTAFQVPLSSVQRKKSYEMIIDYLLTETSIIVRELSSNDAPGNHSSTRDTVQVVTSLAAIDHALLAHTQSGDSVKARELRKLVDDLIDIITKRVMCHENREDLVTGVYESLAAFPPCTSQVQDKKDQRLLLNGLTMVAQRFGPTFRLDYESHAPPNGITADDTISLNGEFDSQGSRERTDDDVAMNVSHSAAAAATNAVAFRASQAAKMGFASRFNSHTEAEGATAFIGYLTSLQPSEFLACRYSINDVLSSHAHLDEKDAGELLRYLGQEILREYEFERSEVSMGVCLDVMTTLADFWTKTEPSEVADVGASLYEWFIKVLDHGVPSPHVYICISSLLQRVIKIRPEYARSLSIVSARTSLFKVLNEASLVVKYSVGSNISDIFGLFVLKEHDSILADVINNLPNAVDRPEGLAVRLFVLAQLGAAWSTLLRQCVFRLFETPGHIPATTGHAKLCLDFVSQNLGLGNTQELFKLFVPQIMYTWLETQTLKTIPYMIFGYTSLSELLRDSQDEVLGQVVMRGKDDEAAQLTIEIGKSYQQLLEVSFSTVCAYCMARDIAIPPAQVTQAPGAEARLRKTLGRERYASLIASNFASILVVLFRSLEQEEQITKSFHKHPMNGAFAAYETMKAVSASDQLVPANQQPSFKASFLVDEVLHLCSRTSYELESLWFPALLTPVFRGLINMIHPALGSLHACSVLRRIRILICMAGSTALALYPLEMILHSLRPFLTDPQCSDDTIGMFQYLLGEGAPYLKEVPRFLAGIAVSTLISMKAFLGSTQESTTQESQHQATMSKAQAFHIWFATYLNNYNSPELSGATEDSFKAIVKASRSVQARGNARKGTYESDLLVELLEDELSERKLLNQPSRNLILDILCTSFEIPPFFRDDIAGSDQQAAKFASVVWKICLEIECGHNFLLWAARVLGRAFAASGSVNRVVAHDNQSNLDLNDGTDSPSTKSKSAILRSLCDFLLVDDRTEVGMAEKTLHSIINSAKGTDDFVECEHSLPPSLMESMVWVNYGLVSSQRSHPKELPLAESAAFNEDKTAALWLQEFSVALALTAGADPLLSELPEILVAVQDLPKRVFRYILHLALLQEAGGSETTKHAVSKAVKDWFNNCDARTNSQVIVLVEALLYLRKQPIPHEAALSDRSRWLDIDYKEAARAAVQCSMFKTSLLFLEIDYSVTAKASKRSSAIIKEEPTELLLNIYEHIDEEDSIYGVQQPSNLASLMNRLEYERAGFKSLSIRGAHYNSQIRHLKEAQPEDEESMIRILNTLDLHGVSQSMLGKLIDSGPSSMDAMLSTARKLEQWDISVPATHKSEVGTIFKALQGINTAVDAPSITSALNGGLSDAMAILMTSSDASSSSNKTLTALAILTEADEVFTSTSTDQLLEVFAKFQARSGWMDFERFEHIDDILSCRETLFGSLSKSNRLQSLLKITQREARAVESETLLALSKMSRSHGALQHALTRVTYLNRLIKPCEDAGVTISAAVQFETARVLWDHGEMSTSIKMLQDLLNTADMNSQSIKVGRPDLFARLGHHVSEARLEKPDEIIHRYLTPAIEELHGTIEGDEAGQVYHEFASFCDQQLQNADGLEDFQRIQRLRERKEVEVHDLERMIKAAPSQGKERDNLKLHRTKAKQWFDIDDREYQRLRDSREAFLRQSLENYLLCLKACDKYDNDVLRFAALWLENWSSETANTAVSRHIAKVGSGKFAALMNQWSSRLLRNTNTFQKLLSALVTSVCVEHPYHGIYQLFAGSKTKGGKDDTAVSRWDAANAIVNIVKKHGTAGPIWITIHNANIEFVKFAQEKLDESKAKPGAKVALRKTTYGQRMEQAAKSSSFPPPTMNIPLRPDRDYSDVPVIAKWQPEFTIASGISMPKIATAIATDGKKYKQLFKSGNDDLRQDAIMEQVFAQVSNLLRAQRSTRQRNLGIRTYKVLPLTATSGIIEFVPNTIPLHEYLIPAHTRHFPKDLKPNTCRKHIADAQSKSAEKRIETFQKVTAHFHPVLRYFFMERFENPDEWFDRRLAYTRSTAAISILGHVLGLGDRHGHNILLDEKTGEVVHIDLGIAFEQGRVLPVPEVVPFRLTRDVVDGMGITKTEGVFRRCCEFTLEALRNESYSIMTILDVLRYDPLYSWSLSPLRLKKMQDAQTEAPPVKGEGMDEEGAGRKGEGEPGEADRALTVVAKKLSRSLSVVATVNELIQQATDERNLALLFCGWAAYA